MDNEIKEFTKEELNARLCAYREAEFTAEELVLEIEPLIKSYFVGLFERKAAEINCSFFNGQKFRITAEPIK